MPVRSFNSVVLKWPKRDEVLAASRSWALRLVRRDPNVHSVCCAGSCARGDYGVGSDVDLVIVLRESDLPQIARYCRYAPEGLPAPADLFVYTRREWDDLPARSPFLWRQ